MSRPIVVSIPHELGRAEARARVEKGFGDMAQNLGSVGQVSRSWTGDRLDFTFAAMGQTFTGAVDVEDRSVRVEVILPGLLGMIADKVRGRLRTEGQKLLEKKS